MAFKKLIEPLRDILKVRGFEEPLAFQDKILPKIKAGDSLFAIAPEGSGKTTSIVLGVIQKLKGRAIGEVPRALIVVKDKQAALELELEFAAFLKGTDLRVYLAYREQNIDDQIEAIYVGVDVVIATPKRLNEIYFRNGINLNNLKLFIVEDAEFLFGNIGFGEVTRMSESIGKCQYLIFTNREDKRLAIWQDSFMSNGKRVKG